MSTWPLSHCCAIAGIRPDASKVSSAMKSSTVCAVMVAIVPCDRLRCRATCDAPMPATGDGINTSWHPRAYAGRMSQPTWAQRERQELCRLLEEVGPDAPTLCGDWTTRDLAAHLIVREARPDAAAGIVFKPMAAWTNRIQEKAAKEPWSEMIHTIRTALRKLSVFSLPKADALANTTEYYVHLEDVRRAEPEWEPRKLPPKFSDSLWKVTSSRARASTGTFPLVWCLNEPMDPGTSRATRTPSRLPPDPHSHRVGPSARTPAVFVWTQGLRGRRYLR